MSLYSALSSGVSGLAANSTAMAVVADNVTNVNTVGYKGTDARFSTLVTGGGGTSYSAGGVLARPQALITKQGLLQMSTSATDLAIDGAGFFVVRTASNSVSELQFTRAGSFLPDASGYLRNDAGLYLQGWRLDSAGNYVDGSGTADLGPVRLSDMNGTAEATDEINIRANLSNEQTVLVGPYVAGDMAAGTVTPHFSRTFEAYDAQGGIHRLTMSYVKISANSWRAEVYAAPGETTAAGNLLVAGTVAFNGDGTLDVPSSSAALFNPFGVTWTNGASPSSITMGLGSDGGLDGLTQFGSESALISSDVNGAMLGSVTSVEVSTDGIVSAVYGNGTIRTIYRLPLATVQNPDGMKRLSGNAYTLSAESGDVAINAPGEAGGGTISANALEASNVDLAEQFTKMIVTQRAYSAAGKIITTTDEMLQELTQLKR